MAKPQKTASEVLDRLADAEIEYIWNLSDEETLAEAREMYGYRCEDDSETLAAGDENFDPAWDAFPHEATAEIIPLRPVHHSAASRHWNGADLTEPPIAALVRPEEAPPRAQARMIRSNRGIYLESAAATTSAAFRSIFGPSVVEAHLQSLREPLVKLGRAYVAAVIFAAVLSSAVCFMFMSHFWDSHFPSLSSVPHVAEPTDVGLTEFTAWGPGPTTLPDILSYSEPFAFPPKPSALCDKLRSPDLEQEDRGDADAGWGSSAACLPLDTTAQGETQRPPSKRKQVSKSVPKSE